MTKRYLISTDRPYKRSPINILFIWWTRHLICILNPNGGKFTSFNVMALLTKPVMIRSFVATFC